MSKNDHIFEIKYMKVPMYKATTDSFSTYIGVLDIDNLYEGQY